jgi:hypothetical protein
LAWASAHLQKRVGLYLTSSLRHIFPRAEALVGDMRLDCVRSKGLT